ncbi:MAG: hypothetical protein V1882_02330 [Candidatus Omnitrophota bacterium]
MKFRSIPVLFLALTIISFAGCAKKADPKKSVDEIRKEVVTMSVAQLEVTASAYAAAIRAKKAEIQKIQSEIQKMPVDKVFNNKAMARRIIEIGRDGEALFERYRVYSKAFQEKGGDYKKIQIEPAKS